MRAFQLSIVTLLGASTLLMAGGDIQEITPFEIEDINVIESEVQVIPPVEVAVVDTVVIEDNASVIPAVQKESLVSKGFYTGVGLTAVRYDTNCGVTSSLLSGTDKTAGLIVRLGYDFNKYIGVETRGIMTTLEDDGGTVKHLGAFLKPMYSITEDLSTYGLIGLAKTTTQGSLRRTDVNGLALGLGLEYALFNKDNEEENEGFGLFADYEKLYYKRDAPKFDALSVGITYDF